MPYSHVAVIIGFSLTVLACQGFAVKSPGHDRVMVAPAGPPTIVVTERPRLVFAAGYGIYFAPDLEVDLYFDHGVWLYFYEGAWYKSSSYRGPWKLVKFKDIPSGLRKMPPGQLKKIFREREAQEKEKSRGEGPKENSPN